MKLVFLAIAGALAVSTVVQAGKPQHQAFIDTTGYFPLDKAVSYVEREPSGLQWWVRYEGKLVLDGKEVFAVSSSSFYEGSYYEDVVRERRFSFYVVNAAGDILLVGSGTPGHPQWRKTPRLVLPRRLEVGKEYLLEDTVIDQTILVSPGLVEVVKLPSGAVYRNALMVDIITRSKVGLEGALSEWHFLTFYVRGLGPVKHESRLDTIKNGRKIKGNTQVASYLVKVGEPDLKQRR